MDAQRLELTVDQFLLGPQEIVLRHRHGSGAPALHHPCEDVDTRRAIRESRHSRQRERRVTYQVGDLAVNLRCEGVYEHEGNLCRLVFLSKQQVEWLDPRDKPPELEGLKISGWVAQYSGGEPPRALRLCYNVLASSEPGAEICDSWYREFPLAPDSEITASIAQRTQRIALALARADDALPDCDVMVRCGNVAKPSNRCRDYCRVRLHCHQMRRFYEQEMERFLAGERALAGITGDPEPLSIIERAQDRA